MRVRVLVFVWVSVCTYVTSHKICLLQPRVLAHYFQNHCSVDTAGDWEERTPIHVVFLYSCFSCRCFSCYVAGTKYLRGRFLARNEAILDLQGARVGL